MLGVGAIVGLLGSVVGKGFDIVTQWQKDSTEIKLRELDHAHELALYDKQVEFAKAQMTHDETEKEVDAQVTLRQASYAQDASYGQASEWCINVLRLMRPGLTFTLIIGYTAYIIYTDAFANYSAVEKFGLQLADMAMMAVAWWFGDHKLSMAKSK